MYIVYGGVYNDTDFKTLDYQTEEEYGPFQTYEEALRVWRGKMGWNIDNCYHRLRILDFCSCSNIVEAHCTECGAEAYPPYSIAVSASLS